MRLFFHSLALSHFLSFYLYAIGIKMTNMFFTRKFLSFVCLFVAKEEPRKEPREEPNLILLESFAWTRISYIINWLNEIVIEYLIHKIRAFGFIFRSKDKICLKCIGFASVTFFTQSIQIEIDFANVIKQTHTHTAASKRKWVKWVRIGKFLRWRGYRRIFDTGMNFTQKDCECFFACRRAFELCESV